MPTGVWVKYGLEACRSVIPAAGAVPIAPQPGGIEGLLTELATRFQAVSREFKRIRPNPAQRKTAGILPCPTSLVTLGIAGAVMDQPGIHHIRFPSPEMDLRPEMIRLGIDTMLLNDNVHLVVLTNRVRAAQYAIADLMKDGLTGKDAEWIHVVRGQEQFRVEADSMVHNNVLFLVDLDALSLDFPYREIRAIAANRKLNTVVLFGNRSHPCLRDYFFDKDRGFSWGVNGAQVVELDKPTSEASLAALSALGGSSFDPRTLPERIREIQTSQLLPSPYSGSDKIRRQAWTCIAGAFAIRDADRRLAQRRTVDFVHEDSFPGEDDVRRHLIDSMRAFGQGQPVSLALARAADHSWICLEQMHRLTVPLATYRQFALKTEAWGVRTPFDRLAAIKNALDGAAPLDRLVTGDLVKASDGLRRIYEDSMANGMDVRVPNRTTILISRLRDDLRAKKRPAVLCYDEADRVALGDLLRSALEDVRMQGISTHVRRITTSMISPELEVDVLYVLQPPSEKTIDRIGRSGIPAVHLILTRAAALTHGERIFRDIVADQRIFSFAQQNGTLVRLKLTSRLPPEWDRAPKLDDTVTLQLQEAKAIQTQVAATPEEVKWRLVVEDVIHGSTEGSPASLPRSTRNVRLENYLVVHFTDGTHQAVHREAAVQLVGASTRGEPQLASKLVPGDIVVMANSDVSSASFGRTIVDLVSELAPKLHGDNMLDENWRTALTDLKRTRNLTWDDVLQLAKKYNYRNTSAQTIYWYSTWMTWRPLRDDDFVAILQMLSGELSADFSKLQKRTMEATARLKQFGGMILGYVKKQARTNTSFAELAAFSSEQSQEPDPLIIPDLGLRASHLESIIEVKEVLRIEGESA